MKAGQGAPRTWAREHLKGLENILIPTMTADRTQLDESSVRHDVRHSKAHGFFRSLCAGIGLSRDEMTGLTASRQAVGTTGHMR